MSWKKVKLGELLTESKIESIKSDPDKRITVRLNLKGVEKRPYERGVEGATKYFIRRAGQFIYGKQNLFKGAFGIIPKELDGFESSSDIPAFDMDKKCLPEWLMFYLRQGNFYLSLESIATGTGSRRIQPARLFEVEIPLPSIKEQQKIIDNCNFIEKKYGEIDDELNRQQTYLQRLRQSILQEAVQGKLSEPGFAGLKDDKMTGSKKILSSSNLKNYSADNNEDAATLLKRIKAEKLKLIKEGKLRKEKELPPITDDEIPFELPKGWVWCRLGEIVLKSEAGKSMVCDKRQAEKNEWGIIKVSAMSWGSFDEKENKVLPKGVLPFVQYKIRSGDYLISRANTEDLIGKSVIVENLKANLLLSDKSIRIKFFDSVNTSYINFYNNSSIAREYYKKVATGTSDSMKNISREQMYLLPFPLPPLVEQQRIVAKVNKLQQQLSQLETQVQQSREYAEQLLQAVLKEAFEEKGTVYEENEMSV